MAQLIRWFVWLGLPMRESAPVLSIAANSVVTATAGSAKLSLTGDPDSLQRQHNASIPVNIQVSNISPD